MPIKNNAFIKGISLRTGSYSQRIQFPPISPIITEKDVADMAEVFRLSSIDRMNIIEEYNKSLTYYTGLLDRIQRDLNHAVEIHSPYFSLDSLRNDLDYYTRSARGVKCSIRYEQNLLDNMDNSMEGLQQTIREFALIRGYTRFYGGDGWIFGETCPIMILQVPLGIYRVGIQASCSELNTSAISIQRIHKDGVRLYGYSETMYIHPHISDHPCFGTFAPQLNKMIQMHLFSNIFLLLIEYLATYGMDPYVGIQAFWRTPYVWS